MSYQTFGLVLHCLRRLRGADPAGESTDLQLLRRFLEARDESAFAALLRRHGPMVLGVCRRVLDDPHDADDAFQAVFVVLVRRARTLAWLDSLGGWLHQTALRVALRARAVARKQAARQKGDAMRTVDLAPHAAENAERQDLRRLLDLELERLPARYRDPLVLCYLEGKTHEEAAQELGCPRGSMGRLLDRARGLLRKRLVGRGVTLPAGVAAALTAEQSATAAVSENLIDATVRTASLVAGGAAGAPGPITGLAEGVVRAMMLKRALVNALVVFLLLGLVAAGLGFWRAGNPGVDENAEGADPAPPAAPAADPAPPAAAAKPEVGKARPAAVKPLVAWAGPQSQIKEPSYRRITAAEPWQELWQTQMRLPGPVPQVDFDQCLIVAIFPGSTVNCGRVLVTAMIEDKDTLTLRFVGEPYIDGDKADVCTPYGLFLLPRTAQRLVLEENVQNRAGQPPVWVKRAQFDLLRPDERQVLRQSVEGRLKQFPVNDGKDSELRAQIREAVTLLLDKNTQPVMVKLEAPRIANQQQENAFKSKIETEQRNVSLVQYKLSVILDELATKKDERAKEPAAWQAHYDYVMARLEAQIAYIYEYNAMLGEMRKEFPVLDPKTDAGWRLVPDDRISDRDAAKNAKRARDILTQMAKDHAGTEWEEIAKEEAKTVERGLRWQAYRKE